MIRRLRRWIKELRCDHSIKFTFMTYKTDTEEVNILECSCGKFMVDRKQNLITGDVTREEWEKV